MVHSLHSLLVSCEQGNLTKVESILKSGEVGVNSADEVDVCPLHVAAANGHVALVSLLLGHGANPDQRTSSGWTPLHQASYHGHTAVVEALLEAEAGKSENSKRNKFGATALNMACAGGHLAVVKLLLKSGHPVEEVAPAQHKVCPGPSMTAALHSHDTVLRHLAESGAKLDKISQPSRWTPLMLAAVEGSKQCAVTLLDHGADPNKLNLVNATALEIAIAAGKAELKTLLSERTGAGVSRYMFSTQGEAGIHTAAQTGDLARLEEILANGESDVDELDGEGATPLMMAAIGGHKEVTRVLIRLGAEVNHQDKVNGWTALMQVISYLLEAGADPTLPGHNGCTALDLATLVDDDKSDLVRMLATQSIQIKPPSLEMSKQARKKIPKPPLPRSISMANLSDASKTTSSGGIKLWWEKFSGRFKRLNRVEMLQGREGLMSANGLQYSELLPTSPVYTLGFTQARPSGHGVSGGQGGALDLTPQFPQTNKHSKSFHAEGELMPGQNLLKTRKLLLHSESLTQSPSASLGLDKKQVQHYKDAKTEGSKKKSSTNKKMSVLNVLKKLHLEEHYPLFVSNEVDVPALKEMTDADLLELGIRNKNERKAILKSVTRMDGHS